MDDRWPYPVSQKMQRHAGSRVEPPQRKPAAPPIAPAADGNAEKAEPTEPCYTVPRPEA